MKINTGQNQHYVPQLLLKNFAYNKKTYVYDKHTGRVERKSIRSVCSKDDFYTMECSELIKAYPEILQIFQKHPCIINGKSIQTEELVNTTSFTTECSLSQIETQIGPILKKIIQEESLYNLTIKEKRFLCFFVALQFNRTPHQQQQLEYVVKQIREKIKSFYNEKCDISLEQFLDKNIGKYPNIETKLTFLNNLLQNTSIISKVLSEKKMRLCTSPPNSYFYISDHPVVLHNENEFGAYGNLGLACPGIEIYMPLSSRLCLAFHDDYHFAYNVLPFNKELEKWNNFGIEYPVECSIDNVDFVNSLQVYFSERYICCEQKEFDLVCKMLKKDPKLKHSAFQLTVY